MITFGGTNTSDIVINFVQETELTHENNNDSGHLDLNEISSEDNNEKNENKKSSGSSSNTLIINKNTSMSYDNSIDDNLMDEKTFSKNEFSLDEEQKLEDFNITENNNIPSIQTKKLISESVKQISEKINIFINESWKNNYELTDDQINIIKNLIQEKNIILNKNVVREVISYNEEEKKNEEKHNLNAKVLNDLMLKKKHTKKI